MNPFTLLNRWRRARSERKRIDAELHRALAESVTALKTALTIIEQLKKPADSSTVVSYMVAYDYKTVASGKHINSPVVTTGFGRSHTIINVDGGVNNWDGVCRVTQWLKDYATRTCGMNCDDIRLLSIQEINRWKKEMTQEQEQSLRQKLAQ